MDDNAPIKLNSARGLPIQYGRSKTKFKRGDSLGPDLGSTGSKNDDNLEWPLVVQIKHEPPETSDEKKTVSGTQFRPEPVSETEEEQLQDELQEMEENRAEISSAKRKRAPNKNATLYRCDQCDRSFTIFKIFSKHTKFHTGERPYVCEVCGLAFIQLSSREEHLRRHDSSYVPFVCPECGFVATNSVGYKAHMRTHSGEKLHRCDTCGKFFLCERSRDEHVQLTHVTEVTKPKCRFCGRKFSYRDSLVAHEETHDGETSNSDQQKRTFDCFCGRASFSSVGCLKRHQRKAHLNDADVAPLPVLFSGDLR